MYPKGTKVVCVNADFPEAAKRLYKVLPVKDTVYTVRATYVGRGNFTKADSGKMDGEIGVLLEEIKNPADPTLRTGLLGELGFKAERFAEVEPDKEKPKSLAKPVRIGKPSPAKSPIREVEHV